MARIRTIKPEFYQDEDLASLSEPAFILAAGLLNHADDEGYFKAHPGLIKAAVFPLREPSVSIHGMLVELSNIGYIRLFEGSDGKNYGQINGFTKHQKINRPTDSKIKDIATEKPSSLITHGILSEDSLAERNREQGTGKGKEERNTSNHGAITEDSVRETNTTASSCDDGFREFWNAYPKKVERKKSLEIWKRKKLSSMTLQIVSDLETRITQDHKWREGFIPNPTTYLNGDRWEDEITTKANGNGTSNQSGRESATERAAWQAAHDEEIIKRGLG